MAFNVLDKINKVPIWQKIMVLTFLAAVEVVLFQQMYWKPLDQQIVKLKDDLEALNRKYKEQKAIADDLVTFQQNTKKLEEDLRVALTQLPKEKEIPTLLRDIYTLGKKSGVEFKSFQPGGEAVKKLYAEVPIKLQIVGSYHEVAVFFDRVGKLSRIVNISNLEVSPGGSKDEDSLLTINCVATTYMFVGGGGS